MQKKEDFFPLSSFGDHIQRCVMTLVVMDGNDLIPLGTGFMISPRGLMMTASHVIKEAVNRIRKPNKNSGDDESFLEFYAVYISNDKKYTESGSAFLKLLPITKAWCAPELDIGYCWVANPVYDGKTIEYPVLALSPGIPEIGEEIVAFGYHNMISFDKENNLEKRKIKYSQEASFSRGKIVDVFPVKRDDAMLPFPCFQSNNRFDHGMSGGPIFDSRGNVCGVVCSSLPPVNEGEIYASYGSLIWPCLATPIELALQAGMPPERVLIYDLIRMNLIQVDDSISSIDIEPPVNGSRKISIECR